MSDVLDDPWAEGQWEAGERVGLMLVCEFCGALPDEWCHVRGKPDRDAERMHALRMFPGMAAWASGYSEGRDDATPLLPQLRVVK